MKLCSKNQLYFANNLGQPMYGVHILEAFNRWIVMSSFSITYYGGELRIVILGEGLCSPHELFILFLLNNS
jgi:hypothetical protein